MKYFNFKRYKFNKIFDYLNFKRYKLYKYLSNFNFKNIFLPKPTKFVWYLKNSSKFAKNTFYDVKKYIYDVKKYIKDKKYKNISIYFGSFIFISVLFYLSLPYFYNYSKLDLEKFLCEEINLKCSIQSNVKYSILPTPRLKFEKLIVKDITNKKKNLAIVEKVEIKISILSLHNKNKLNYKKARFINSKINFDLAKFSKYNDFFTKKFNPKSLILSGGEIIFFDGKQQVANIRNINLNYISKKNINKTILKGDFIDGEIYVSSESKDLSQNLVIKLSDLGILTKIDMNKDKNKNVIGGNILFKQGKNKFTAIFDYKDNKVTIKHSNLRNIFLDGKLSGNINFAPFFDFNLDLILNSINFNRLYSTLVSLDENSKKELFRINKKINGILNLTVNKIFSKYTLIHSLESQIKFINGNILLERALLNLGKLGAADVTGVVKNEKKFSNLKFEKNIYIDNLKRFYNKFGVYNKEKIPYNLFVSGNFDLSNLVLRISEISGSEKLKTDDVSYYEQEFNDLVLEDGYATLFDFSQFKKFVKAITNEVN